jgi:SAM-dependent methyltransferase
MDHTFYPNVGGHWDDSRFRETILRYLRPHMRVLDLGAGAGILPQMNFRGLAREVVGIDLDHRVVTNPYLDRGIVGSGEAIPLGDAEADIVISDNVLEHLAEPEMVFKEIRRVLRPGGIFLAKTPNKWHYMPLIARTTPLSFHRWFNRLRGRAVEDTFPTLYRANSRRDLRRIALGAGLEVIKADLLEARPEYLRMSAITYMGGIIYERLVNTTEWTDFLRILLIVHLRRPVS